MVLPPGLPVEPPLASHPPLLASNLPLLASKPLLVPVLTFVAVSRPPQPGAPTNAIVAMKPAEPPRQNGSQITAAKPNSQSLT